MFEILKALNYIYINLSFENPWVNGHHPSWGFKMLQLLGLHSFGILRVCMDDIAW